MVGCDRDLNVCAIGGKHMPPAAIDGCPWKTISISPRPYRNDVFCRNFEKNLLTSTLSLQVPDNGGVWQGFECRCDRGWPYTTNCYRRLPLKNYSNQPPPLKNDVFCQNFEQMCQHWACKCRIMVGCDRDLNVGAIEGDPMPPTAIDGCPWKTISISPHPYKNDVFCRNFEKIY